MSKQGCIVKSVHQLKQSRGRWGFAFVLFVFCLALCCGLPCLSVAFLFSQICFLTLSLTLSLLFTYPPIGNDTGNCWHQKRTCFLAGLLR